MVTFVTRDLPRVATYTMQMDLKLRSLCLSQVTTSRTQPHQSCSSSSLMTSGLSTLMSFTVKNTVCSCRHPVVLKSQITVLTGRGALSRFLWQLWTHTRTGNILWIFPRCSNYAPKHNSWQTHSTRFCLCFSVFLHLLFSSANSLFRDNEVAIVIVVVELFTRDLSRVMKHSQYCSILEYQIDIDQL